MANSTTKIDVKLDDANRENDSHQKASDNKHEGSKPPQKKKLLGPKKPKTAYNFYQLKERDNVCNEVWDKLGLDYDRIKHNAEVARIIGKRWRELSTEKRGEFQRLAKEDKLRYQRELAGYESSKCQSVMESSSSSKQRNPTNPTNYATSSQKRQRVPNSTLSGASRIIPNSIASLCKVSTNSFSSSSYNLGTESANFQESPAGSIDKVLSSGIDCSKRQLNVPSPSSQSLLLSQKHINSTKQYFTGQNPMLSPPDSFMSGSPLVFPGNLSNLMNTSSHLTPSDSTGWWWDQSGSEVGAVGGDSRFQCSSSRKNTKSSPPISWLSKSTASQSSLINPGNNLKQSNSQVQHPMEMPPFGCAKKQQKEGKGATDTFFL
mmetsp:Transcript_14762/g.20532  ORF Transcript_14762/g.20532 Transcript_14762/m.20532 type:complete len:376 (+) Transcript_14762:4-1131(+)